MVVVGGVQGDEEVSYSRGNAGKRIDVYMPSILSDWGSNGSIMVEFYVNSQFMHFLVCGQPNLALTRRYSRIFTGAIPNYGYSAVGLVLLGRLYIASRLPS